MRTMTKAAIALAVLTTAPAMAQTPAQQKAANTAAVKANHEQAQQAGRDKVARLNAQRQAQAAEKAQAAQLKAQQTANAKAAHAAKQQAGADKAAKLKAEHAAHQH